MTDRQHTHNMAERTFTRAAAPDLSCPVCLEMFVAPHIPKDLPNCDHVCCEVCLTDLVKQNPCVCPECRKTIIVPNGGVSKLRTNLKLRSLAERYPKRARQESQDSDMEEPICVEHDDAKMRYFCAPCHALACQLCLLLKHKDHITKKVTERYDEIQLLTNECQKVVDERTVAIREIKSVIEKKVRKQKSEIDQAVKDHFSRIREASKAIKQQMDASKALILDELNNKITNHTNLINGVDKLKSSAQEDVGKIPHADYVLRYSSLQKTLETLKVEGAGNFESSVSPVSAIHRFPEMKCVNVGDIEQIVTNNNNNNQDAEVHTKTAFAFKFEDVVTTLRNRQSIFSPPFLYHNIPWKMNIRGEKPNGKCDENQNFDVGLYLYCIDSFEGSTNIKVSVSATLKIVRQNGADQQEYKQSKGSSFKDTFSKGIPGLGYANFITSIDLLDEKRGHVKDDSLIAVVELESVDEVEPPCDP